MPPTLPAPPRSLASILKAASDPDVSPALLALQIGADPSFASMVLRAANSAALGGGGKPISSVRTAATRLGMRSLRNLALCHAARSCVSSRSLGGFDLDRFWEESLRRAVASELLATHAGDLDPSEAFTIGLLQDLGVLALVLSAPEHGERWIQSVGLPPSERLLLERELFGYTHADVAQQRSKDWALPDVLAVPMRLHHDPEAAPSEHRRRCENALAAEALAAVLGANSPRLALARARAVVGAYLDVTDDVVDDLLGELGDRVSETAQLLGIRIGAQPSLSEVLRACNRGLVDMNLSYEEIVQKLERTIREKEALAEQLDKRNRELERLSVTDALTGLPNRRVLFKRASEEIHRVARTGGRLALLVGDIDLFKRVNDTYGHVVGDEVLKLVADALRRTLRTSDLVARIGGEEFAILLPDTDGRAAMISASRLLGSVAKAAHPTPHGHVQVTISVGIGWLEGPHGRNVDADAVAMRMYRAADEALYAAKEGGRNRAERAKGAVRWATARSVAA